MSGRIRMIKTGKQVRERGICDCCKTTKVGLTKKKLMKGYKFLCDECDERMKYVNICLRSGTDLILKNMPERFHRATIFSVNPIE
jgi:hypothetical protein